MKTTIGVDIELAASIITGGGLVAIPTETVYGLAGNAFDQEALHSIFRVKGRPLGNPLIIHLADSSQLNQYVSFIPKAAVKLIARFSPGPLTYLLPKKDVISDLVTAGSDKVAVRFPNHPLTKALLRKLNLPLAAPSANKFTALSPTLPEHVLDQLGGEIPYILDGGPCEKGIESTVIGFEDDEVIIYRPGSITIDQLKAEGVNVSYLKKTAAHLQSPGMLPFHYAPKTKLILTDQPEAEVNRFANGKIGVLVFSKPIQGVPIDQQFALSEQGDIEEAASKLYAALHIMDKMNFDVLIAARFPESGLGISINDRLQRASSHI